MRLLDLFCGAGGAAEGYRRAGFEVIGVDIAPQPNYPFEFHQGDVRWRRWLRDLGEWDAIHASPPCPRYSSMTRVAGTPADHPDLVQLTRELLQETGLPYIIENVVGAPLEHPVQLCGSSLGLGAVCRDGHFRQLRRHRLFEANFSLMVPPCAHTGEPVGVYGNGGGQQKTVWSGGLNRGYMANKAESELALGIDWMTKRELSNAVPPAYTEYLGVQLAGILERVAGGAT